MLSIDVKLQLKKDNMHFCFDSNAHRIVIFGPSGSGKTTLLKTITGFYRPSFGRLKVGSRIFFDAEKKIDVPVYKRKVGYLPQESTLFPNMTVKENILYGFLKCDKSSNLKNLEKVSTRLQIADKLENFPDTLSGGQQKRAALARILMMWPDILLLDEPFVALDSPIRECLKGIVIEISDEMNIPVIFVSHNIEDSFSLGSEIVVINSGQTIEYGSINKIFTKPKSHLTAQLLDFKNIWHVDKVDGSTVKVANKFGLSKLLLRLGNKDITNKDYICIKPGNIGFLKNEKKSKSKDSVNILKSTVKAVHPRGNYFRIVLDIDGFNIFADIEEKKYRKFLFRPEDKIKISIRKEDLIICRE